MLEAHGAGGQGVDSHAAASLIRLRRAGRARWVADGECGRTAARLERWLERARASGSPAPASVAFVTVGADGRPSARTVSLKRIERDALIVFHRERTVDAQSERDEREPARRAAVSLARDRPPDPRRRRGLSGKGQSWPTSCSASATSPTGCRRSVSRQGEPVTEPRAAAGPCGAPTVLDGGAAGAPAGMGRDPHAPRGDGLWGEAHRSAGPATTTSPARNSSAGRCARGSRVARARFQRSIAGGLHARCSRRSGMGDAEHGCPARAPRGCSRFASRKSGAAHISQRAPVLPPSMHANMFSPSGRGSDRRSHPRRRRARSARRPDRRPRSGPRRRAWHRRDRT